jgi:hypothetical protein
VGGLVTVTAEPRFMMRLPRDIRYAVLIFCGWGVIVKPRMIFFGNICMAEKLASANAFRNGKKPTSAPL